MNCEHATSTQPTLLNNIFRRITSTGRYIPEIDGLRFIAIISVLLVHAHAWLVAHLGITDVTRIQGLSTLAPWLMRGGYGVPIFFVISGFILSLPLLQGGAFSYRTYLLRRLTRLEPPYIISMMLIFVLLLITGKYTFNEMLPEFLASLVYLNNIIFPDTLPMVNGVTWSLEIEVQFYLLCPALGLLLRNNKYQLLYYILLLLIALAVQKWAEPDFLSLISVGSYFLLGYVLAYAYLRKPLFSLPPLARDMITLASFITIWALLIPIGTDRSGSFIWYILEHVNLFLFFYMVVVQRGLPAVFTAPVIATIGGMCYSIYLLHFALFSVLGRALVTLDLFEDTTTTYYVSMVLLLLGAIGISSVFYLLLERPFMQRDWHRKWIGRLRGIQDYGASGHAQTLEPEFKEEVPPPRST